MPAVYDPLAAPRRPVCCFLHGDDPARPCGQPARFTVYSPPFGLEDYTEACGDHVEALKCTPADTVERLTSPS